MGEEGETTFFLYCLCIASRASLMVTPLRFRAVTSRPRGKWRSIFLTGGVTRNLLRISLSSIVEGDVFSFLFHPRQVDSHTVSQERGHTSQSFAFQWQSQSEFDPSLQDTKRLEAVVDKSITED